MIRLAALMVVVVSLSTRATHTPPDHDDHTGYLVIAGGGTTTSVLAQRVLALAGGADAPLLIVPLASDDPDAGESSRRFWATHGANNVTVLEVTDRMQALAAIERSQAIWMPGGDQSRLLKALTDANLIEAIRHRYQNGAVIGGTSAGAAVISSLMIVGGNTTDSASVNAGSTTVAPALGLLHNAIIDQHFVTRRRFNRLFTAVLDHPTCLGIGVDERTALVISPDRWEVIGEGTVTLIDARSSTRATTAVGQPHAARDIRVHVLRDGDHYVQEPAQP